LTGLDKKVESGLNKEELPGHETVCQV